jgi:polygalacturonase
MHRREFLRVGAGGVALGLLHTLEIGAQSGAYRSSVAESLLGGVSVRQFGAVGDGVAIDSQAINRAIEAVAKSGGGQVYFPAGVYLSYSIRLKSHVGLYLEHGAVILAAATSQNGVGPLDGMTMGGYDAAEVHTETGEAYQDYGHNHWQNSLIWGDGLTDIAIEGPGLIWGKGLTRGFDFDKDSAGAAKRVTTGPGVGNKAIALKNCTNTLLRDFKILEGGWFGLLATGVENLVIDNLVVDSNRDGMDIDCCRNVRITNCTVNTPWDDGICLKSSYALGDAQMTENVTISNCYVTGDFELGSVLDGTRKRAQGLTWPPTGRIKFGTESNGGFRNVAIANCVFESCRGIAIESVDGAACEDVAITNITMRDVRSAPLFLRLGSRLRGPKGIQTGIMRRILVSNITSWGAGMIPSILAGVAEHPIEDVQINDVFLEQVGGGDLVKEPEELAGGYPEPEMFGALPATGLFARHVRNLEMSHVEVRTEAKDARAAIWMGDVQGARVFDLRAPEGAAKFDLRNVRDFRSSGDGADLMLKNVDERMVI